MEFKSSKYLDKKMRETAERMKVLKKKRERFGLTDEEAIESRKLLGEFWVLESEMVDSRMEEVFFPMFYDAKTKKCIATIQKYLPWNGGKVIRNKDVDLIMDTIDELNGQKRKIIYETLEELHETVLMNFAKYENAANEDQQNWLKSIGDYLTNSKLGNSFHIIYYIDERYRDLADMLGYDLPEVEILEEEE